MLYLIKKTNLELTKEIYGLKFDATSKRIRRTKLKLFRPQIINLFARPRLPKSISMNLVSLKFYFLIIKYVLLRLG